MAQEGRDTTFQSRCQGGERLKARIDESAIKVSTVKAPHTYMKAVGTRELEKILEEELGNEDTKRHTSAVVTPRLRRPSILPPTLLVWLSKSSADVSKKRSEVDDVCDSEH